MDYMHAYEFYCHDKDQQPQLIGILPERRRDVQRINPESILNWIKKIVGNDLDMDKVVFVEVTINRLTGEVIESKKYAKALE